MKNLKLFSLLIFFMSLVSLSAKENTNQNYLNITDFGAKGDGETDDTEALKRALKEAVLSEGTIYFPTGNYMIHPVKIPSHITLMGHSAWGYANKDGEDDLYAGRTNLIALSGNARALLDLGDSRGTRILGLTLDGKKLGKSMHGIYARHSGCDQYNCFEDLRINYFSGSGIKLERSWVFSVRRCLIMHNGQHGIDATGGYDGWIIDCQLTANKGAGLFALGHAPDDMSEEEKKALKFFGTASIMVTANRVEWNRGGGILLNGSNSMQITGCSVDHNFGPGIKISNGTAHTVTGNLLRSNGVDAEENDCSQIWIENCKGASVTGNTIWGWYNRKEYKMAFPYPYYGIIVKNLEGCVISQNAMYHSSSKEGVKNEGGNEACFIDQNMYVKPKIEKTENGFRVMK